LPRYRIRIVRAESAERVVDAKDEEAAVEKVRQELERPYSYLGRWERLSADIEVLEAVARIPAGATAPDGGPLLLSVKDAAKNLGISYGTLYEMINRGEVPHVRVGKRILISRENLKSFIEANTRTTRW
jgi:excisionase family DNA binding protein